MAFFLSPVFNGYIGDSTTGGPLVQGKIYTYAAGTTTPVSTYADSSGGSYHTNPIIIGSGYPDFGIWLRDDTVYRFMLKDENDNLILDIDNVVGVTPDTSYLTTPISNKSGDFTVAQTDTGKFFVCDNGAAAINVSLPNTITAGFRCYVLRKATGTLSLITGGTMNGSGSSITPAQWKVATVTCYATGAYSVALSA